MERCRLYAISPPRIELPEFSDALKSAFDGGDIACFQLRLKNADDDTILRAAEALLPICHQHDAAFILNDRADLAKQCGADGVHFGQDDGVVADGRKALGDEAYVGISCHDSKHLAMVAGEDGADYVAFGAFYPTKSKSPEALAKWGTPTLELLNWWQTHTVVPCVAIGGMTPQNCEPVVRAGADFIAVITAIWEHAESPAKAVIEFNDVFEACHAKAHV